VELFALAVLIVHLILYTLEKFNQRRLERQLEVVELAQAVE